MPYSKRFLFAFAAAAALLLAMEGACRLWPLPRVRVEGHEVPGERFIHPRYRDLLAHWINRDPGALEGLDGMTGALEDPGRLDYRFRPGLTARLVNFMNPVDRRLGLHFPLDAGEGGMRGPMPGGHPNLVLCLGDSCTYGWGLPAALAYPARLQELLGDGYLVSNCGMPGYTVLNGTALEGRLEASPRWAVLNFGSNDAFPARRPLEPASGGSPVSSIPRLGRHSALFSHLQVAAARMRWRRESSSPPSGRWVPPDRFRSEIGALGTRLERRGASVALLAVCIPPDYRDIMRELARTRRWPLWEYPLPDSPGEDDPISDRYLYERYGADELRRSPWLFRFADPQCHPSAPGALGIARKAEAWIRESP